MGTFKGNQVSIYKMLWVCSLLLVLFGLTTLSAADDDAFKLVNTTTKYLLYNGGSYYYIKEANINWFQARASCESMGFNLISFETIEEFNAINRFLDDTGATSSYWTSGTDFQNLGHHAWFPSGKPVPSDLWFPNQPDHMIGHEHCDTFRFRGTHKMNDEICTAKIFYICELNTIEPKLQIGY